MDQKISYADHRVKQIIQDCFPNYKGRKIRLSDHIPSQLNSWWDEGSRTYYTFYQPSTRKVFQVHSNHPLFEANQPRELHEEAIPEDVLLISHHIFCGKDAGIIIHVKPDQTKLLPL